MKQEFNTLHIEEKTALELGITSSFRAIAPSYEGAHSWYMSQKPTVRHNSVRSRFYIPVFGSAFAAVCAFVMIISLQDNAMISQQTDKNAIESNVFTASPATQDLEKRSTSNTQLSKNTTSKVTESPILSKIDKSINASSRSKEETFVALDSSDALTSLFE